MMKRMVATAGLLFVSSVTFGSGAAKERHAWVAKIRKDHPRLFFNAETWPAVKARALGVSNDHFKRVGGHADSVPDAPEVKDWGNHLMSAAFVYRVTGEPRRLANIKRMSRASLKFYQKRYAERKAVSWYSTTRISFLAALDWVWNDLSPRERKEFGSGILKHVDDVQPGRGKPKIERCNQSGYRTGFYGTPGLLWPAGLLLHGEGIDDAKALAFIKRGLDLYLEMLAHRAPAAGDDGGAAASTVTYCFEAYPWAEWNFFHTWLSATGEDISGQWPYVAMFPNYVLWNWIPGGYEYGYGDTPHKHNRFPAHWMYTHMSHTMHFYGHSLPEWAGLARYVRDMVRTGGGRGYGSTAWSCYPFLVVNLEKAPPLHDPKGSLPPARYFEKMGQIFMRSGLGPDDTCALFVCGGTVLGHSHWDANHFTIYKKGFLALDSGTRYPTTASKHCNNYYRQTVAHNCILIRMPPEKGKVSYGAPVRAGGQYKRGRSTVVAFETGPNFTYVAGDATESYHPDKSAMVVRQFIFVPPDHFVVFDRVTSQKAEYRKSWLLHTANEPTLNGKSFLAEQNEGHLFCRTLLPTDAVLDKIGGQGREFLVDGVNYAVTSKYHLPNGEVPELMGRWRVEVSPGSPRAEDVFLHLIQVSGRKLHEMSPTSVSESDGEVKLVFAAGRKRVTLNLPSKGQVGGHIRIAEGDILLVDRPLTGKVLPQSGLGVQ